MWKPWFLFFLLFLFGRMLSRSLFFNDNFGFDELQIMMLLDLL
eukprot:CAMPEP_0178737284 /NCGR_PEP_ID=MMETSP0744-20121128/2888_1 /TAXON_ID=913974 /ORGANISM="Nitzschia punctata, Strain CCMP561" /LENGTH=42 /DNA_ID= /DNA_START= /DNA_END= /DNA_ORIENTATION=